MVRFIYLFEITAKDQYFPVICSQITIQCSIYEQWTLKQTTTYTKLN